MSCQQVPRLTEDPYIFTEPPVTNTIYHSQFGKLTPVRTKNQKLLSQQPNKKLQNNQQPQQQQRLNGGIVHTVNGGVHSTNKNLNKINSLKTIIKGGSIEIPLTASPIITAGTTTTTTTLVSTNSNVVVTAGITTASTTILTKPSPKHNNKRILLTSGSPTIATVLPQQTQQHNQNNNNNNQQTHTYHIPPLLPPPPLYHQTQFGQQQQLQKHHQQQQQQQRTSADKLLTLSSNNHSISTSTAATVTTTPSSSPPLILLNHQTSNQNQQQQQQEHFYNNTSLVSTNLNNNCHNIESVHQQLYQCPTSTAPLYSINIKTEDLLLDDDDDDNNLLDEYKNVNKLISNNNNNNNNISDSNNQFATIIPKSEEATSLVSTTLKKLSGKLSRTKNRSYSQTSHHEALQRISSRGSTNSNSTTASTEWHAPDTYVFDYLGPGATQPEELELAAACQKTWWMYDDRKDQTNITNGTQINILSREERLTIKAANLRRQAIQYKNAFSLRSKLSAKRRLICVSNAINKFKITDDDEIHSPQKCCIATCSNDSLALTAYCYIHITQNVDQRLFHPCTAKFSDNTQCRVPVFDISHELPLCREHAWKRDNYNRILQEQKPKKPPRKKSKPSAMTRPPKRNKKKKKPTPPPTISQETFNLLDEHGQMEQCMQEQDLDDHQQLQQQQHHQDQQYDLKEEEFLIQRNEILLTDDEQQQQHQNHNHNHNHNDHQQLLHHQQQTLNVLTNNSYNHNMLNHHLNHHHLNHNNLNNLNLNNHHHNHNLLKHHSSTPVEILSNMNLPQHEFTIDDVVIPHLTSQEFINVCENSSAYESSEDTGVGGLSESEMIGAHDVIEEMPLSDTRLLEEHDLTNVLNQLPEDAFNELFTVQQNGPFEPTQEEQEDLERALEAVDKQVKSLEQMTGFGDFLDVVDDQMLNESELVVCSDVLQGSNNTEIRGLVHT